VSEADRAIAQVRAMLGEIRGIADDIDKQTREAIKEHESYLKKTEKDDEERAKKARAGELGPDWQRLQRQIDLGETSMTAVVHGIDDSVAAENVRRNADENAEQVARVQAEQVASGDEAAKELQVAFSSAQQHKRELLEQMERIRNKPLPTVD
jgi:hypothetical protein